MNLRVQREELNNCTEENSLDVLGQEEIATTLSSVAVEWRSPRGLVQCPCSTPLDFATAKVNPTQNKQTIDSN